MDNYDINHFPGQVNTDHYPDSTDDTKDEDIFLDTSEIPLVEYQRGFTTARAYATDPMEISVARWRNRGHSDFHTRNHYGQYPPMPRRLEHNTDGFPHAPAANDSWVSLVVWWLGQVFRRVAISSINPLGYLIMFGIIAILAMMLLQQTVLGPINMVISSLAYVTGGVTAVASGFVMILSGGGNAASALADGVFHPCKNSWINHDWICGRIEEVPEINAPILTPVDMTISKETEQGLQRLWGGFDIVKMELEALKVYSFNYGDILALGTLVSPKCSEKLEMAVLNLQTHARYAITDFVTLLHDSHHLIDIFRQEAFFMVVHAEDAMDEKTLKETADQKGFWGCKSQPNSETATEKWDSGKLKQRCLEFLHIVQLATNGVRNLTNMVGSQLGTMSSASDDISVCTSAASLEAQKEAIERKGRIFGEFWHERRLSIIELTLEWLGRADPLVEDLKDLVVVMAASSSNIRSQLRRWEVEVKQSQKIVDAESMIALGSNIMRIVDRIDPEGQAHWEKESERYRSIRDRDITNKRKVQT